MNPETLRELATTQSYGIRDTLDAAADAWELERIARHMEAAKFLSQIAAWKASCEAAEKRLEEAERKNAILRAHLADIDGLLRQADVDAANEKTGHVAALAKEEK